MQDYDLVIVGAGSGNMLPTSDTENWRIAIVESDRFGGTCLNRGCIPSKMFVYAADVAEQVRHAARFGISAEIIGVDWPSIRERVFGRIDPIHDRAVEYRRHSGVDVYLGQARFVADKTLDIDGTVIHGKRIVLAVGSRPSVPDIAGLGDVIHHTSDTIMRLDQLPGSMLVVGGGFIGAEMSHVFGALGTHVTIVHRGESLLNSHDHDIRRRFTDMYAQRFDLRLGSRVERVERRGSGVVAHLRSGDGAASTVTADVVLLATGRVPNSDLLDPTAGGLTVDEHGHIRTDDTYATSAAGVWAIGDTANHFQLKHMANAETRLVRHNLLHPDKPERARFDVVPSAVFADPQVATVGVTEDQLRSDGRDYVVGARDYSDTAYGWALEDTTSFAKVLADPKSRKLLGAHILGPQAATLIQPLIQAMCLANTVDQLAHDVLYIHPALSEVVENALLQIP
ncbi:MAG: mycothione reductase [Acidimicrobiales bacterium]